MLNFKLRAKQAFALNISCEKLLCITRNNSGVITSERTAMSRKAAPALFNELTVHSLPEQRRTPACNAGIQPSTVLFVGLYTDHSFLTTFFLLLLS